MLLSPVIGLLCRPNVLSFAWKALIKAVAFEPPPHEPSWTRPHPKETASSRSEHSGPCLTDKARGMVATERLDLMYIC